jgi:chromatin segregation and condensation protein Rec8/ScpA/Scc1 (kleisin family)
MQQKIFDMLLKEKEVSWKDIIYDLVKTEQMDPWHIDITLLTKKYIEIIKSLQEHSLRVSGKILLAAAFMLRMKSSYLMDNDISKFDALLNPEEEEDFEDECFENGYSNKGGQEKFPLIPKNPQARNRKVSVHDLVDALQRAMATKKRVLAKIKPVKFKMPGKSVDIMEAIQETYQKIVYYSKKDKTKQVSFSRLLPPNAAKHDKVFTFLPLLHLENEHKLEMQQKKHFAEIMVNINKKN